MSTGRVQHSHRASAFLGSTGRSSSKIVMPAKAGIQKSFEGNIFYMKQYYVYIMASGRSRTQADRVLKLACQRRLASRNHPN